MSFIVICLAVYVLGDIIGYIGRKSEEEKRQKLMSKMRNIVNSKTITPDNKIENLKMMFDDNLI